MKKLEKYFAQICQTNIQTRQTNIHLNVARVRPDYRVYSSQTVDDLELYKPQTRTVSTGLISALCGREASH